MFSHSVSAEQLGESLCFGTYFSDRTTLFTGKGTENYVEKWVGCGNKGMGDFSFHGPIPHPKLSGTSSSVDYIVMFENEHRGSYEILIYFSPTHIITCQTCIFKVVHGCSLFSPLSHLLPPMKLVFPPMVAYLNPLNSVFCCIFTL